MRMPGLRQHPGRQHFRCRAGQRRCGMVLGKPVAVIALFGALRQLQAVAQRLLRRSALGHRALVQHADLIAHGRVLAQGGPRECRAIRSVRPGSVRHRRCTAGPGARHWPGRCVRPAAAPAWATTGPARRSRRSPAARPREADATYVQLRIKAVDARQCTFQQQAVRQKKRWPGIWPSSNSRSSRNRMGLLAASSVTGGPHLGRQCDAASISMLEMPAAAAATPGDNRRSDPAMQMQRGHKQSAAGYGVRRCRSGRYRQRLRRQVAGRTLGCQRDACLQGSTVDVLAVEVGRRGVHPDRQRVRLQETEQRPQLVVDHQRMGSRHRSLPAAPAYPPAPPARRSRPGA